MFLGGNYLITWSGYAREREGGGGGKRERERERWWMMASSHLVRAYWHARIPPTCRRAPACLVSPAAAAGVARWRSTAPIDDLWTRERKQTTGRERLRSHTSFRLTFPPAAHALLMGFEWSASFAHRRDSLNAPKFRVWILCAESEESGRWARRSWQLTADGSSRSSAARCSSTRVKRHAWKSLRESLGLLEKRWRIKTTHKSGLRGGRRLLALVTLIYGFYGLFVMSCWRMCTQSVDSSYGWGGARRRSVEGRDHRCFL